MMYKVEVTVKGISKEDLLKVMNGWIEIGYTGSIGQIVYFEGMGNIANKPLDSHEEIENHVKEINPHSKVKTSWVLLEGLPFEVFGGLE